MLIKDLFKSESDPFNIHEELADPPRYFGKLFFAHIGGNIIFIDYFKTDKSSAIIPFPETKCMISTIFKLGLKSGFIINSKSSLMPNLFRSFSHQHHVYLIYVVIEMEVK